MCIVAIAWQIFDGMPLCLISNRDELYDRKSLALHQHGAISSGRDLQAGGTWLGVGNDGRWAILTNFRDGSDKGSFATSRGDLVDAFLASTCTPKRYLESLERHQNNYAGFNLIVGTRSQAAYMSNRGAKPTLLANGVYVLSNGLLSDEWNKCARLRQRFSQEILPLLHAHPAGAPPSSTLSRAVWQILEDRRTTPDDELPDTGVPLEMERALSAIFVELPGYGTRVSNLLMLSDHQLHWLEKQQYGEKHGEITALAVDLTA